MIFGHLRPANGFFLSIEYFWKITEKFRRNLVDFDDQILSIYDQITVV